MRFWLICTLANTQKVHSVLKPDAGVGLPPLQRPSLASLLPLFSATCAFVWPRLEWRLITLMLPRFASVCNRANFFARTGLNPYVQVSSTALPLNWCKAEQDLGSAEGHSSLARAWRHLSRHLSRSFRGWYHRRRRISRIGRGTTRVRQSGMPGVATSPGLTFKIAAANAHGSTLMQLQQPWLLPAYSAPHPSVYFLDRAYFFPRLLPRLSLRAVRPRRWKKRRPVRYHTYKINRCASLNSNTGSNPTRGRGARRARQAGWRRGASGFLTPSLQLTAGWRAVGRYILRKFRRRRRLTPLSRRLRSVRSVKRTRVWRLFFSAKRQRRVWWRSRRRQLPLIKYRARFLKTFSKQLRRHRLRKRDLAWSRLNTHPWTNVQSGGSETLTPSQQFLRLRSSSLLLQQTARRRLRRSFTVNKAPKQFGRLCWAYRRRSRPYFWRSALSNTFSTLTQRPHQRIGAVAISAPEFGVFLPRRLTGHGSLGLKSQSLFKQGSEYQQTDIRLADFIKKFRQPQVKYRPGLSRHWRHHRRSFNIFFWTPWGRPQKRLTAYLARLRHVAGFSYLRAVQLTAVQIAWRSFLVGRLTYSQAWAYVKAGFIAINGTRCWNPLCQLYTSDVLSFNHIGVLRLQGSAGSFHTKFWQGWRQWGVTANPTQDLSGLFEVDELTLTVGVLMETAACFVTQGMSSAVVPFTTLKCYNWKYIT